MMARACERLEQRLSLRERQAGVGDALAVDRRLAGHVVLSSFDQMALDHRAEDLARAGRDLLGNRAGDFRLAQMILVAVAVRAVDHYRVAQAFAGEAA